VYSFASPNMSKGDDKYFFAPNSLSIKRNQPTKASQALLMY